MPAPDQSPRGPGSEPPVGGPRPAPSRLLVPARYLALGARVLGAAPASIGWRAFRHLSTLGSAGFAALIGGATLRFVSFPAETAEAMATLAASPAPTLSPSAPFVAIALGVAMMVLRGATMAMGASALRQAITGKQEDAATALRNGWAGFTGLSFLQASLVLGAGAAVLPVAAALAEQVARGDGASLSAEWLVVALGVGLLGLATLRYAMMLVEAHLTWRPGFVATAVRAALGAPLRRRPLHGRLWALWAFGSGLVTVVGATFGTIVVSCWFDRVPVPAPALGGMMMTAVIGVLVGAWFDASLAGASAHALGVRRETELFGRPTLAPVGSAGAEHLGVRGRWVEASRPLAFPPAPPARGVASAGAPSATEPRPESEDTPGAAAPAGPDSESRTTEAPPEAQSAGGGARTPTRLADLEGGIGRAAYRTAGGDVEVSWNPDDSPDGQR